jgi:hypothetical protein
LAAGLPPDGGYGIRGELPAKDQRARGSRREIVGCHRKGRRLPQGTWSPMVDRTPYHSEDQYTMHLPRPQGPAARLALAIGISAALSACAAPKRIVAFGDIHGDLEATRSALRIAGAIDDDDRWIGGELIVVQTGDQLDRGDNEQAILDLFERLRVEAEAAGGAVHALLGNHELMNVSGDLRYVTKGGFADFADAVEYDPDDPSLAAFAPNERARMAALRPGGPYALLLAKRDVILQLDGNVFVHGGVLPQHVAYGIDRINEETREWLRGEAERPLILDGEDSPQWVRLYSREPDSLACEVLGQALELLDAKRMVMGHTVQGAGITSACDAQAWRIDVGMATYYGGHVQVLEIVGDSVRVLRPMTTGERAPEGTAAPAGRAARAAPAGIPRRQ